MNFGERMAQERREREDRFYRRLNGAIKRHREIAIWILDLNNEVKGALHAIQQVGMKAELTLEDDKIILRSVEYKSA